MGADVRSAIQRSSKYLPGFNTLTAQEAMIEGSGQSYHPREGRSTISGLMQITDKTFQNIVRDYGKELQAAGVDVSNKDDPYTQVMVSKYLHLQDYERYKKRFAGAEPSSEILDLMYNLGAGNFDTLMNAREKSPEKTLGEIFPADMIAKNKWEPKWTVQEAPDKISDARMKGKSAAGTYRVDENGQVVRSRNFKEVLKSTFGEVNNRTPVVEQKSYPGVDSQPSEVRVPSVDTLLKNIPTIGPTTSKEENGS